MYVSLFSCVVFVGMDDDVICDDALVALMSADISRNTKYNVILHDGMPGVGFDLVVLWGSISYGKKLCYKNSLYEQQ